MRRISTDFLLAPKGLEPDRLLLLEDDGRIADILPRGESSEEGTLHLPGIVCSAFVNAHCHLELSYLKGQIPEGTGMAGFIEQLQSIRGDFPEKDRELAAEEALVELYFQGTAAVADICNGTSSLQAKARQPQVHCHNFVELFGMNPQRADHIFEGGLDLAAQWDHSSVTPHAPYSVSKRLRDLIYLQAEARESLLSIHLLESEQERQLFRDLEGPMWDLFHKWGFVFQPHTYDSPLDYILEGLPPQANALLVHCTQMRPEEIEQAAQATPKAFFVLCPLANEYIHGTLPPADQFARYPDRVCIGTDSLAGNHQLNPLAEIRRLQEAFGLSTELLLRWASENGARALGLDPTNYEIAPGNRPFLIHISGIAPENANFTSDSRAHWL